MSHTSIATYNPGSYEREKVREIVPQYLREDSENLISFLEEYYQYLNRDGYASYELNHVVAENDIDNTSVTYLDSIQSEIAKIVPESAVMDRNTLYKRIVHFYKSKGTKDSVATFFRLFFDESATIYEPGVDLLKPSQGDFNIPTKFYLRNNYKYDGTTSSPYYSLTSYNASSTPSDSGISISPSQQPTLGDSFKLQFTSLLFNKFPSEGTTARFLGLTDSTSGHLGPSQTGSDFSFHEPGTFNIIGIDDDGTGTTDGNISQTQLIIKQQNRRGTDNDKNTITLPTNIFDATGSVNDVWHNVEIEYKANDDDISLEVSGSNIVITNSGNPEIDGTYAQSNTTKWLRTISENATTNPIFSGTVGSLDNSTLSGGTEYTTATNVATTSSGSGTGLTVDITASAGSVTGVTINKAGSGYASGETITIDNNSSTIVKTLSGVTNDGNGGFSTATNVATTTNGGGSGLTIDINAIIDSDGDGVGRIQASGISKNASGSGYAVNDVITIPNPLGVGAALGISAGTGSGEGYDASQTITNVSTTYSSGTGSGTGLTVDITTDSNGDVTNTVLNNPGTGYAQTDVLRATGVTHTTAQLLVVGQVSENATTTVTAIGGTDATIDVSGIGSNQNTGLYASEEPTSSIKIFDAANKADLLINGQKYAVVSNTGIANWITVGASTASPAAGTVFTYNGATPTLVGGGTASVQHVIPHWQIRQYTITPSSGEGDEGTNYEVIYEHALSEDLHTSDSTITVAPGVTRSGSTPVSDVADVVQLPFMLRSTLQSKQTADVIVRFDQQEILRETVQHNGGYYNPCENFSIFSHNKSISRNDDTQGALAKFKLTGANTNNFDYRFVELDKNNVNRLVDFSGNSNEGVITQATGASSTDATLTEITQLAVTNYPLIGDDANGTYTVSNAGTLNEEWSGPNNHKFAIEFVNGVYNWHWYDVDDNSPSIKSTVNIENLELLPKPWEIVRTSWTPELTGIFENTTITSIDTSNSWGWDNNSVSLGAKPSILHPLPEIDYYGQDTNGFLSSIKKLQDSKFYQDFSYEITTGVTTNNWSDFYTRLVHPAGLVFFSKLLVEASLSGRWNLEDENMYSSIDDNLLRNLLPPYLRASGNYNGYHSPKFQPGWIQALQKQFATALGIDSAGLLAIPTDSARTHSETTSEAIKPRLALESVIVRLDYVRDEYLGLNNGPQFWNDVRSIKDTGFMFLPIGSFTQSYQTQLSTDTYEDINLSNPIGSVISTS